MNPDLVEFLACPRCGPGRSLVLRADRVAEGRVRAGFLGCSNCRAFYLVEQGVADLRHPPHSRSHRRDREASRPAPGDASENEVLRLAALIGVARGPATIAVAGNLASRASGLLALLPDVEVVALAPRFDFAPPPGPSHFLVSERLPLRDEALAGIALAGPWAESLLDEASRIVASSGRVVLLSGSPEGEQAFRRHGFKVLASEFGAVVGRPA